MTKKALTVRELYEMLEPLVDELGDVTVTVRYDGGTTVTPIKNRLPYLRINNHGTIYENRTLEFEEY
jgi:hypothetical protein